MKIISQFLSLFIGILVFANEIPKAPSQNVLSQYTQQNQKIIKLGEDIINNTNTHPLTKANVGNDLSCSSCHRDGGKRQSIGSFVGTATVFPTYRTRAGTVQTLQDRILNCFVRSMNGTRPRLDSQASIAMTAYVSSLSQGLPLKIDPYNSGTNPYYAKQWHNEAQMFLKMANKATHKDYLRGQKLYTQKCAACHQKNGSGIQGAFPPVWGKASFNIAAGLGQLNKLPIWLKSNMPQGQEGSLSNKDAFDIALYVDAQQRPSINIYQRLLSDKDHINESKKAYKKKGTDTVRSHFKKFGLNIDTIRADKKIK